MTKRFPVFDCDSHVVEPPAVWDEYVPAARRPWVKTQFHFHTDTELLSINGRVVPAARERSNAAEVGWPRWPKALIGSLTPGTEEWKAKLGRVAGCRDPQARLRDMDALGIDQVMLFPTWFVRLALLRDPEAARILVRAYNDWVDDYAAANRTRLHPCALLPMQSVEYAIDELRRVAKKGFKAAAVRPCFWNGRYPTLPEFDPLWREFEELGIVLTMHTFPSREALTTEWAERIARTRGTGQGLLFTDESVVYSPGQFVSNIVFSMEPTIDASESLGFIMEAMTWLTTVLMTGWLDKFPRLRAAVMESNATWLPLVLGRSKNFLDLYAFQRGPKIRDPYEVFYERCFIAFESDEAPVYRMWDLYENVGIWSSDYPHHDAEDAWEALELMDKHKVPEAVQRKLLGENARRLYGIEPVLAVTERVENHEPQKLPW
ncbi:MAG: amidohydrolase [Candidatus Rokubacteria bacterium]|nr:amidohydrolase [Candidatus Rokubacteria bacterium]